MWDTFALTVAAEILIVYLSGFLILKACGFSSLSSLICAPLVTVSVYVCLGIAYDKMGICGSWETMVLPLLFVSIVAFCTSVLLGQRLGMRAKQRNDAQAKKWKIAFLYVLFGCVIAGFYFVLPLNGACSFGQGPDNASHLSCIQSFIESGNYSSLNASMYHDIQNPFQDPSGNRGLGGFYPAGWYCVAALSASLTGATAAVAANASLFVFLAVIFPLNVFLLLNMLEGHKFLFLALGAVVALAFGAFPWGLLTFGPLYPNFAAFVMVPALIAVFVYACESAQWSKRIKLLILFAVGLAGIAFLQTNAVFTVGVFLLPYCAALLWRISGANDHRDAIPFVLRMGLIVAFLFVCVGLWLFAYNMPIMQGVVSYPWTPFASLRQEVVNIALLSYRDSAAQPILGLFVIVGAFYLIKKKRNRWLIAMYVIACFMCIVAAVASGNIRSFVIGFWYTDSYRIAAIAALAAIPLATYGIYAFVRMLMIVWDRITDAASLSRTPRTFQKVSVAFVLFVVLFYPSFTVLGIGSVTTALGEFEGKWFDTNNNIGNCVLDGEEQKFLAQVEEIVGDDLVINKPDDGSVFAYGGNGIDVFYKRTGIEAYETDSRESQLFRDSLCEYATNRDVQDAIEKTEAKYLLMLDTDVSDDTQNRYWFDHYYEGLWLGMDAVNDDTPGFRVVLSEGDMRLYEIEPVG